MLQGRKQEVRGPVLAGLTRPYFGKLTNSADPDYTPHGSPSDQGRHSLLNIIIY